MNGWWVVAFLAFLAGISILVNMALEGPKCSFCGRKAIERDAEFSHVNYCSGCLRKDDRAAADRRRAL